MTKPGFSAKRPSANGVEKSIRDLQEGTKRFNVDISDSLHKRLRLLSVETGDDMTVLVRKWIEEKLDEHDKGR